MPGPVDSSEPDNGAAETPEIEIEVEAPEEGDGSSEPDDLEELELEGRKARIPKAWKDLVEQGKDYRYKTGIVANDKRAVDAEKARYTALVKQAEQTIKAHEPTRPDAAMLDRTSDKYDPDTYHLQRAQWEGWAQKSYAAEQERKRLEGEETTKAERLRGEQRTTTEREMLKAFPQWRDASVRAADRAKIEAYVKSEGVDQEELDTLDHDHRIAKFAYKAMLYDAAVAKSRARKDDAPANNVPAAPVRRVGGGGGASGGVPKGTDAYIAWRKKGGKM